MKNEINKRRKKLMSKSSKERIIWNVKEFGTKRAQQRDIVHCILVEIWNLPVNLFNYFKL